MWYNGSTVGKENVDWMARCFEDSQQVLAKGLDAMENR